MYIVFIAKCSTFYYRFQVDLYVYLYVGDSFAASKICQLKMLYNIGNINAQLISDNKK